MVPVNQRRSRRVSRLLLQLAIVASVVPVPKIVQVSNLFFVPKLDVILVFPFKMVPSLEFFLALNISRVQIRYVMIKKSI